MAVKAKKLNPESAYQEGRREFLAARYGKAIKAWKPIATLPMMRPILAEAYLRRGLEQTSVLDFEQALQLVPGDDRPLRALIGLLLQRGDMQGAQRTLARHGAAMPELAEIVAACSGKPPQDSRKKLLRVLAQLHSGEGLPDPRSWPARLRPLGETAAALVQGAVLPERSPGLLEPLPELQVLFRTAALLERGIVPVDAATELVPGGAKEFAQLEGAVVRRLTVLFVVEGNATAAETLIRRFVHAFNDQERAALHVRIGALHFAARRFPEAAIAFTAACSCYAIEQAVALAWEGAGDDTEAIAQWRRVLRREERQLRSGDRPALAKVHLHIAHLAWQQNDFRTAIEHFQKGLAAGDPENPELLEEYAECLDLVGQEGAALPLHLRYLRRVPGDTRTLEDVVDDRMLSGSYEAVLQVIETIGEIPQGATADFLHSALAFVTLVALLVEDEPEWVRRTHEQLLRIPQAAFLAQRTAAIIAARAGQSEEAQSLLENAQPLMGDALLLKWGRLIDGVAQLRVGRLEQAEASFAPVMDGNRFKISVAYCLMQRERTGSPSCAGTPEGHVVEDLLSTLARKDPALLLGDPPRRSRRCPHFQATLGHLRAAVDPEDMLEAIDRLRDQEILLDG